MMASPIERSGAFRDVIRASNRQESEIARLRDAFAAKSNRGERKLKLYHGTSLEAALRIESQGFQASATGCLGPGVYLARADKALRFAQGGGRHGGRTRRAGRGRSQYRWCSTRRTGGARCACVP